MRKRFVTTIIVCLSIVLSVLGFVACENTETNSDTNPDAVVGKTYTYENFNIEFSSEVTDEVKAEYEEKKSQMQAAFANMKLTFKSDGVFTLDMGENAPVQTGYYGQEGKKVVISTDGADYVGVTVIGTSVECEVDGDKMTMKQDMTDVADMSGNGSLKGVTVNITLKVSSVNSDEANKGNKKSLSVADKKFDFSGITVSFEDDVTEEDKIDAQERADEMKEAYVGMVITFATDGTFTLTTPKQSNSGTYTQFGNMLTLIADNKPQTFMLNGETLSAVMYSRWGCSYMMVLNLSK